MELHTASELGLISGKYLFDEDAILYSKIRPNLNKVAIPGIRGVCSADMYPLWVRDPGQVDREFLYFALTSESFVSEATSRSFRTGIPKINREDLEPLEIQFPPLREQRRIAEIISTWDVAIEKTNRLRALRMAQLDTLRERIFTRSDWQTRALKEISSRIRATSDGASHPVMTISSRSGFVLQSDKYSRDMAGTSLANYTLLSEGDFSYNKGNSLTYPQGCVFALKEASALVPSVYFSFRLADGLSSSFYEHFFAAGMLNRQLERIITSGVRGNGLLNVNTIDFFNCWLPLPSRSEQDMVAALLDEAAREVDLLRKEAAALSLVKRGLMQKLLTGHVRTEESALV